MVRKDIFFFNFIIMLGIIGHRDIGGRELELAGAQFTVLSFCYKNDDSIIHDS